MSEKISSNPSETPAVALEFTQQLEVVRSCLDGAAVVSKPRVDLQLRPISQKEDVGVRPFERELKGRTHVAVPCDVHVVEYNVVAQRREEVNLWE